MTTAVSADANTASNPLVLSLSGEELYVLMRVLKVRALPGVDMAWLNQAADGSLPANTRSALAAATNGLAARGFIEAGADQSTPDTPTLRLPAAIIATIGTCAFGDCTIQLSLASSFGPVQMFFHEFRKLSVVHTIPQPDIHQFTVLDGRAGMLTCLSSAMALEAQVCAELPVGRVAASQLRTVREMALLGQTEDPVNMLAASGLPSPTNSAFVRAIAQARAIGSVAIAARGDDETVRQSEFAFVVSPGACFLLLAMAADPSMLEVRAVSANDLRARIGSQLPRTP